MTDYYQTLGVDRNAAPDAIKKAYRKLASQHHPDKGGDKAKFQEIQSAYDTLSDPQKRALHDNPRPQFNNINMGGQGFDFQTIFDVFGARFQHPGQQRMQQQARMSLWIMLKDAAQGGRRNITVGHAQGTQVVDIEIPAGISDGDSVQYPGIGPAGMTLIITFRIHPDAQWTRQGLDLVAEQVLDIWHLISGTQLEVRDLLDHTLSVTIAAGTQPGTMVRLRGRGIKDRSGQTGDMLLRIQTRTPKDLPEDLVQQLHDHGKK